MAAPQRKHRRRLAWSLVWQTEGTPVPTFWYFRTQRAARVCCEVRPL